MTSSGGQVFFRVDGGGAAGMGHILRCLALARVLRDSHGCSVLFGMSEDLVGISRVQELGWRVLRVDHDDLGGGTECDALVIDLPAGASAEAVSRLRGRNRRPLIVLMDGTCTGRLLADLVVCPIERLSDSASWAGFCGERYEGPAYAILDPAYAHAPRRGSAMAQVPRVLVTMGGSDPCGVTLQALRALDSMPELFEIVIAAGPAFMHDRKLEAWRGTAHHGYEIKRENSLLNLMVNSDLAVVSFGTTVYELAATGLPAIALSISEDHWRSAEVFEQNGSLINLGLFNSLEDAVIQDAVRRLLSDHARWLTMARRGQETVDGKGAQRVGELLLTKIHKERRLQAEDGVGKSQRA